jgi:hypothetical protein
MRGIGRLCAVSLHFQNTKRYQKEETESFAYIPKVNSLIQNSNLPDTVQFNVGNFSCVGAPKDHASYRSYFQ